MEIVHGSAYGYRTWSIFVNDESKLPELHPVGTHWGIAPKWSYGITEALCVKYDSGEEIHPAPDNSCECGLYALADKDRFIVPSMKFFSAEYTGRVELFGRVVHHTRGYRAQYARIDALDRRYICLSCRVNKSNNEIRYMDDGNTYAAFIGPIMARRDPFNPVDKYYARVVRMIVCQECRDEIEEQHNLFKHFKIEPASPVPIDSLEPMKPIFETLTRLYCDGRVLTKLGDW